MTGIIKDQLKLQHSNQESIENTFAVCRKEFELLKNKMKKKEDLNKTLLDTIKELTTAKSHPLTYASEKTNSKDNHTSSSQDLHPRNTIVIAGDSIINGVFEDRLRRKDHMVKVRNFPGANVEDMPHNLTPLIRKKPSHLIIHAGTNDAKKFTSR